MVDAVLPERIRATPALTRRARVAAYALNVLRVKPLREHRIAPILSVWARPWRIWTARDVFRKVAPPHDAHFVGGSPAVRRGADLATTHHSWHVAPIWAGDRRESTALGV